MLVYVVSVFIAGLVVFFVRFFFLAGIDRPFIEDVTPTPTPISSIPTDTAKPSVTTVQPSPIIVDTPSATSTTKPATIETITASPIAAEPIVGGSITKQKPASPTAAEPIMGGGSVTIQKPTAQKPFDNLSIPTIAVTGTSSSVKTENSAITADSSKIQPSSTNVQGATGSSAAVISKISPSVGIQDKVAAKDNLIPSKTAKAEPPIEPKPKPKDEKPVLKTQTLNSAQFFQNFEEPEPQIPTKQVPAVTLKQDTAIPVKQDLVTPAVVPVKQDPIVAVKQPPLVTVAPVKKDPVVPLQQDPTIPVKQEPIVPVKQSPVIPGKQDPIVPVPQTPESVPLKTAQTLETAASITPSISQAPSTVSPTTTATGTASVDAQQKPPEQESTKPVAPLKSASAAPSSTAVAVEEAPKPTSSASSTPSTGEAALAPPKPSHYKSYSMSYTAAGRNWGSAVSTAKAVNTTQNTVNKFVAFAPSSSAAPARKLGGGTDKMSLLLQWCQGLTAGYKDVSITNLTTSFKDGLAFCAMIHKKHPELIDFASLKKENGAENLKIAFDAGESLGITKLLDVEDIVEMAVPDKLSMATYLFEVYKVLSKDEK
ncbi:MICAL 2 [Pelomyxa schiedti]|nr:MICAL 2 [Pelomyxa schiedti]